MPSDSLGQADKSKNNDSFICGVIEGFYGKPWTFQQRKDLFKRLREFSLNAFMYAPKDDTKHRSNWRQLYNEQELNELRILIKEANENEIDFYYSLAPGLDMVYSDLTDLNLLKRKYDQLVSLGCESFAILFDDIEPQLINEKDKKVFDNYAQAQVYITNLIYKHLNEPKLFFCPTEYCESRAVPNVQESRYLNIIGQELNQGVDFMWSGSRVISKYITVQSMEMLTKVIRRKPIIWENLHANDYDKERVFLGPYSGRSTAIIPKIKGVMTNPNCEFEANYIAIHTLAHWSKCNTDTNQHNRCNFNCNDAKKDATQATTSADEKVYNPERALRAAIIDWLPHLNKQQVLPSGWNMNKNAIARSDQAASNQLMQQIDVANVAEGGDQQATTVNVDMLAEESAQSAADMVDGASESIDLSCNRRESELVANDNSCEMQDVDESTNTKNDNEIPALPIMHLDKQQGGGTINYQNLSIIVDLFFLPFDHGAQGLVLLNNLKWLKDNSEHHSSLLDAEMQSGDEEVQMKEEMEEAELTPSKSAIWLELAEKLNNFCVQLYKLVNNLISDCPNKLLIVELYPYLADLRDLTTLIMDYIKYLNEKSGESEQFYYTKQHHLHHQQHNLLSSDGDDQEPWVHRGGFIGDIQRLLSSP